MKNTLRLLVLIFVMEMELMAPGGVRKGKEWINLDVVKSVIYKF